MGLISWLIVLPLLTALVALLAPDERWMRRLALAGTLLVFLLSLGLWLGFDPASAGFQFVESVAWVPDFGISYTVGIDGISLLLVLLTTLLSPLALLSTWQGIRSRVREFLVTFLVLEAALIGVFVALDLFLFYVFWEFTLVPMIFIIGIWGYGRRVYAAVKFLLFTLTGGVLMLIGIIALYLVHGGQTGQYTFLFTEVARAELPLGLQIALFLAFAIAFAIKVPVWPLHTWLPDAHTEAPTAGSVVLAGVLLKMGSYGFVRFGLGLFPQATVYLAPWMAVLGIVGILYGAWICYGQQDLKRLVAYSSVSHMGLIMLGIAALNLQGLQGSILQMVNHGLSTGALFLLVGMLYDRRHSRLMADFGGLWRVMPLLGASFLIVALSSIGLPGLNGFVGEFTILLGAFAAEPWWAVAAVLGVVMAAIYLLTAFQRVFQGELTLPENEALPDLTRLELAVLVPLLVLIFWIGLYPSPFLEIMEPSAAALLEGLR